MDDSGRRRGRVATVQVRNFISLKEVLVDLGVDPLEALESAGLPSDLFSDPEKTVLYADVARLWSSVMRRTNCDDLGLRIGQREDATAIGLVGLVSMNSATVGDALQTAAAGLRMSDSGGVLTFSVRGGVAFADPGAGFPVSSSALVIRPDLTISSSVETSHRS